MITIVGYGSLLSESSARQTAPSLKNFRLVYVEGYKRIFNKVGVVFFERGIQDEDGTYVSSCATRCDPDIKMVCCAFECNEEDLMKIYEREHRFRWIDVEFSDVKTNQVSAGRMCTEYNDRDYKINKCVSPSSYHNRVGQYYSGELWRDDILPNKVYLSHCLKAVRTQGQKVLDNFLDTSFLADGETTIRSYLEKNESVLLADAEYSYSKSDR